MHTRLGLIINYNIFIITYAYNYYISNYNYIIILRVRVRYIFANAYAQSGGTALNYARALSKGQPYHPVVALLTASGHGDLPSSAHANSSSVAAASLL